MSCYALSVACNALSGACRALSWTLRRISEAFHLICITLRHIDRVYFIFFPCSASLHYVLCISVPCFVVLLLCCRVLPYQCPRGPPMSCCTLSDNVLFDN